MSHYAFFLVKAVIAILRSFHRAGRVGCSTRLINNMHACSTMRAFALESQVFFQCVVLLPPGTLGGLINERGH